MILNLLRVACTILECTLQENKIPVKAIFKGIV